MNAQAAATSLADEVECVVDPRRAAVLLAHPLRLRILRQARDPVSASTIARTLRLPRQKVNYHLRELLRARFVRRAGDRKKRNMVERRFVATAGSIVLAPDGLEALASGERRALADRASAGYLVALAGRVQREAALSAREAALKKQRIATLAIDAEIRFESAEQRARFAAALERAITETVALHASPSARSDGRAGAGRPYRLAVTCHPIPSAPSAPREKAKNVEKEESA